jgi:long-chain acyl-CoA synthetase
VRRWFVDLTGGNLVEGYGLSETSPVTHCNPVHDGVVKDGSIGLPFPETDACIVDLDDPDKTLKIGETGEVAIRGPQVMKGYWNRPDETDMVLRKGWLLTGDIGKMDEEGYFYIVDRKKDMVNVGGLKVYPREVEELLFEHPAVKEAAVVGMPDAFSGEVVRAFVVLKDPAVKVTEKEIIEFCAPRVARYKVPKKVEFVPELPKTLIGKVLRRKLREPTS